LTLTTPDFLSAICSHVSMGGSPIEYCTSNNIRYDLFSAWLSTIPPQDAKRYADALVARDEWFMQEILRNLHALATLDVRQAYNPNGTLRAIKDMSPSVAAAISSVKTKELFDEDGKLLGYTNEIRFWDKNAALKLLGTHLAMYLERHSHHVTGAVQIMPMITIDGEPLRYNLGTPGGRN